MAERAVGWAKRSVPTRFYDLAKFTDVGRLRHGPYEHDSMRPQKTRRQLRTSESPNNQPSRLIQCRVGTLRFAHPTKPGKLAGAITTARCAA